MLRTFELRRVVSALIAAHFFLAVGLASRQDQSFAQSVPETGPPVVTNSVKWLSFSATEHKSERTLIKKLRREEFSDARVVSRDPVRIYLAVEDIGGSKKKEVFAYFFHPYYCGSHGCALTIYERDAGKLEPMRPPFLVLMDVAKLPIQREIGVLETTHFGWRDLLLNNNLWRWDTRQYQRIGGWEPEKSAPINGKNR